jgi:transcription-repair coupling factor (superfamily II helicase)
LNIKSIHNLWGASKLHFLSNNLTSDETILIITENNISYEHTLNEVKFFLPNRKIFEFPEYSMEPFEQARILPEIESKRSQTLFELSKNNKGIIVTTIYGLLKALPPVESFKSSVISLQKGTSFNIEELLYYLDFLCFVNVEIVSGKGEYAKRGEILDIFPIDSEYPIRIEFFDDEIEYIYKYDIESLSKINDIEIYDLIPASELLTDLENFSKSVKDNKLKEQIENFGKFAGSHWFANNIYDDKTSIIDYIGKIPETFIISEDFDYCIKKWEIRLQDGLENIDFTADVENNFYNPKDLLNILGQKEITFLKEINDNDSIPTDYGSIKTQITPVKSNFYEPLEKLVNLINGFLIKDYAIFLAIQSPKFIKLIETHFKDYQIPIIKTNEIKTQKGCYLYNKILSGGYIHKASKQVLITAEEIFGFSKKQSRAKKKEVFKTSLSDLENGDFVVHIDYGIGKFLGLTHKKIGGIEGDFIEIEYSGAEILYVPVDAINQIQKYIGSQTSSPKLNSLQSTKWAKVKQQAYKSAKKVAFDILKLYAERKSKKGFSLKGDETLIKSVENSFEYEETEDQITAIFDVFNDMENSFPMERLVCGDVGFGKTEVAIRAAIKAVSSGKQVAVLAPTTILARQHFETFSKRFEDLPVKIEVLSRFKTPKEIKNILLDLEEGKIDVIIGTHRILSKDVIFNDLGLLIIDEEQRFGVAHKEKIKTLRTNIDVLSMSATPIPRTLQMSLSGLRDISVIETPPEDRLPVITKVINTDEQIRLAIETELKRGGQVYFLHNNVQDIELVASNIQQLAPLAKIRIAHGQMTASKMETVLTDFYTGEIDVLVCTTIIENGLDIPNANTIIINNAHAFGLSQLYQIKGRVGRSDKRGHCFLIVKSFSSLGNLAQKRLKIIQQLSDLGSGFKIATYDLQLRGAGDLLGADQSGFVVQVGYELYMQLIEQAVNELKGEDSIHFETEITSSIPYYLPAEYIIDTSMRINYYNIIACIKSIEEKNKIFTELEEQYGMLPISVINLLNIMLIKNLAANLKIKKILFTNLSIKFTFDESTNIDPLVLINNIKDSELCSNFKNDYELQLTTPESEYLIDRTISLLNALNSNK